MGVGADASSPAGREDGLTVAEMQPVSGPHEAGLVPLPRGAPIWGSFFMVAPLVLVATKEDDGVYDVAPKHMAMPLGWQNYFCFVCTPAHGTYGNAVRHGAFTVSFPRPSQIVETSIAASPRDDEGGKPALDVLPTFAASNVDGVLVAGCAVYLECALERVVDGFGDASLIVGSVVAGHVDPAFLREPEGDDGDRLREAPLLAYVSPGRFASVGDTLSFPFPVDFRL
jgi:flavin reductase (DIM6/NTAB) family NADH-FMN oxidoreductase RutF